MSKGGYNGGSTLVHAGSSWGGRGSVTSQPADKPKRKSPKPKLPRRKGRSANGNGLTIPEQISRATERVQAVESEIVKTKRLLAKLERDLVKALEGVVAAQSLRRRTALGTALHEAQKAKAPK